MAKPKESISLLQYSKDLRISKQGAHKRLQSGNLKGLESYETIGTSLVLKTSPDYFDQLGIKRHR